MKAKVEKSEIRAVRALPGTHELVVAAALRHVAPGGRALDLGAGTGALAERLQVAGFRVTAADAVNYFELDSEFVCLDFNQPDYDRRLSPAFDVITSVEVIEHLENPFAFLRGIARLLSESGVAVVTTPNVDNIAGRLKFFLSGKLRPMDSNSPEHITPIHLDLFERQIVPRTGLKLVEHAVHPKGEFPLTGRRYFVPFFWLFVPLMHGPALTGDSHIFVLKRAAGQD
ncbi:MAG: class I SAM-dependent methyltransferase [Candidatus Acidiferrales bacterium]